jgi:hypothetical protein
VPINSIAPEAVNYFIFLGISSELSFVPERYEPATKINNDFSLPFLD